MPDAQRGNVQVDTLVEQEDNAVAQAAGAPAQEATSAEAVPAAEKPEATAPKAEEPKAEDAKPAKRVKSTAKKTRTVELTLTVTGTADGEWQADLVHGTRRIVSGLSVPAAAVARAAKELHEDIANEIEVVVEAAREQHRSRMEELEAELAKVKQALAELND
ncbi:MULTISPECIES: DUF6319 family protein [Actinosynnema]|uniref:Mucin n=1 Tax=Actinosynnema pretiosum TaxID=42197 RepID=A0A290Z2K3_9PSEU|nr:DUF6319 family protein [Actinosynnema pretiosum]ATE53238.1 hypothetical protein CNX65_08000 [Actinosynnema pretiosum]